MWMLNDRLSAAEAKERGLINRVVPDADLREETRKMAMDVAERGPFALAAIKHAFLARHGGVAGLSRGTHDLLLRPFLETKESKGLGASFREKRWRPISARFSPSITQQQPGAITKPGFGGRKRSVICSKNTHLNARTPLLFGILSDG